LGQNDRSSGSLPLAELNPLMNPLLAENMGRWAEVYFTSPPERREQAVSELIRELEAERSRQGQGEESGRASDSSLSDSSLSDSRMVRTPVAAVAHTRCDACGRENPGSNKYCGMCGAGLGEARAHSIFGDYDSRAAFDGQEYSPRASAEERTAETETEEEQTETASREKIETSPYQQDDGRFDERRYDNRYDEEISNQSYPAPRLFGPASRGNGLSLFQAAVENGSDHSVDWADEAEPSSPYRYYIGAVLAVIILLLGYMAWKSTQTSQNAHVVSAPPPAAASDTAAAEAATPAPAPSAPAAAEQTPQPSAPDASAQASSPRPSSSDDEQKNSPQTKPTHQQVAESAPAAAIPSPGPAVTPAAQPAQPSAGNGGEELAVAQRYLNNTAGQRRDTAEAAKWLWKSVAKHNGQATVLLSDLYLKGDGVSKNCDQARVLLDSAARKGVAGAGERLRNLPAFGCP